MTYYGKADFRISNYLALMRISLGYYIFYSGHG